MTVVLLLAAYAGAALADPAFTAFLQSTFPAAQALGVSRATFDAAIAGLEPDLTLPDLAIPGRPETAPQQPEFVQTPGHYLREANFQRLAAQGKELAAQYKSALARIEREFGVPGPVVLAIWARETDYGREIQGHDALQVLATQAYTGKRRDFFRSEFLYALRLLQDGVPRSELRSSWGGAMGLTQLLPSEYYNYAVHLDGAGKPDIWHSVPDALASAAKQLKDKGWRRGEPWAIEVRLPASVDCTQAEPSHTRAIGDWLKAGYAPAYGRKLKAADLSLAASLLLPEGASGPGFLTPKNYYVLKDYNTSDLYVLFVGHLADRIAGAPPFEHPWSKAAQLKTADVETMQQRLVALGLYHDKVDGKAGMLTRAALGAYQKNNGLTVDCWPTAELLTHMTR